MVFYTKTKITLLWDFLEMGNWATVYLQSLYSSTHTHNIHRKNMTKYCPAADCQDYRLCEGKLEGRGEGGVSQSRMVLTPYLVRSSSVGSKNPTPLLAGNSLPSKASYLQGWGNERFWLWLLWGRGLGRTERFLLNKPRARWFDAILVGRMKVH